MRKLKLVITADEDTCQDLDDSLRDHALVHAAFQGSGNWYINGETGPEWFTVSFVVAERRREEFEAAVSHELGRLGKSASNMFWDWR